MYEQPPPADSVALTALTAWLDLSLGRCLLRRTGSPAAGVPGWSVSARDVLTRLGFAAAPEPGNRESGNDAAERLAAADDLIIRTRAALPAALTRVAAEFTLSDTELRLLCLVLAPELDGRYGTAVAVLQDDMSRRRPGLTLLAELIRQPALTAWDLRCTAAARMLGIGLLRPAAPAGTSAVDAGLAPSPAVVALLTYPSASDVARAAAAIGARHLPPVAGAEPSGEEAALAARLRPGTVLRLIDAGPWFHRVAAAAGVPLIDGDLATVEPGPDRADAVTDWTVLGRLIGSGVSVRHAGPAEHAALTRAAGTVRILAVDTGITAELLRAPLVTINQRAHWWTSAAARADAGLSAAGIRRLATTALVEPEQMAWALSTVDPGAAETVLAQVQRAARDLTRAALPAGVQQVEPAYDWDDIVLPAALEDLLKGIAAHVLHAGRVLHEWGFAGRLPYGNGVVALFSGPSGTGKTMAAQIIAGDLGVDLFHVDLSRTISKYIGETEKNLDAVFDAAERAGAVLLFDEADALFGKRTEVKDAHDRHANVEVAYLLQRMESFRGLAILTTNAKQNIDGAFVRRLRFVADFTMPTAADRRGIWRKAFPDDAPIDAGLNLDPLANRLPIPGGSIQNIALHAAFQAAANDGRIDADAISTAARRELHKIGMLNAERDLKP
ncbi:hypothetical protein FB565_008285 [Actinoplanes lutulentus]|uniref:ATPase family protein associated with various cellular activities (AAA) n=1 Tax=Actinoplanes lutulentus TaxID=1287878 RepID=A0A327Z937_9ACTN|nr:ATP-binding protein [Actinoplanes lutulentus]MBB2948502.1 hypothetical protein [Actinoplanes lutulentus]RAK34466.1 ATPase family protein associated with various cellular activities (AAA) [Actinoplanes lutulentus]